MSPDPILALPLDAIDLRKTLTCGQCFRWDEIAPDTYLGVAGGYAAVAEMTEAAAGKSITLSGQGDAAFWRRYFDLDTDYAAAHAAILAHGGYLRRCAEYGAGIRILRQEPFEALVSFLISQCNNIPRIKQNIGSLCAAYGEPIDFHGQTLYAFPGPAALASLDTAALQPLRLGYRAPYVLSAARAVDSGALDLDALARADRETAIARLRELPGVGPKVAECAALYGLRQRSGFPVDTWMRRALKEHFPKNFDPQSLGDCAGLCQQYIFYYTRSNG